MFEHVVDVPPELIWAFWTRPEKLMQWLCPLPWKTIACEIDLRLAGRLYTVMQSLDGQTFPNEAVILKLFPIISWFGQTPLSQIFAQLTRQKRRRDNNAQSF